MRRVPFPSPFYLADLLILAFPHNTPWEYLSLPSDEEFLQAVQDAADGKTSYEPLLDVRFELHRYRARDIAASHNEESCFKPPIQKHRLKEWLAGDLSAFQNEQKSAWAGKVKHGLMDRKVIARHMPLSIMLAQLAAKKAIEEISGGWGKAEEKAPRPVYTALLGSPSNPMPIEIRIRDEDEIQYWGRQEYFSFHEKAREKIADVRKELAEIIIPREGGGYIIKADEKLQKFPKLFECMNLFFNEPARLADSTENNVVYKLRGETIEVNPNDLQAYHLLRGAQKNSDEERDLRIKLGDKVSYTGRVYEALSRKMVEEYYEIKPTETEKIKWVERNILAGPDLGQGKQ